MRIMFLSILALVLFGAAVGALAQPVDTISFDAAESEKAHALTAKLSEITKGGLEEPARTLLPREPVEWQGGKVAFTMKVDPALPNYFTVKLWGGDRTRNRLTLFCEGRGEKRRRNPLRLALLARPPRHQQPRPRPPITPHFDRIGVVREDTQFEPSGLEYQRPDWVNFGFANGGPRYPGDLHSALHGRAVPRRGEVAAAVARNATAPPVLQAGGLAEISRG